MNIVSYRPPALRSPPKLALEVTSMFLSGVGYLGPLLRGLLMMAVRILLMVLNLLVAHRFDRLRGKVPCKVRVLVYPVSTMVGPEVYTSPGIRP